MAARVIIWVAIFGGMYLASRYSFHLFHNLAELFSIVVACGIFMVAWNTRQFAHNRFLLFLGVAYLMVAVLDLLHTLTYQGMGVFPGLGPDPPIQFWVAARYVEALSLVTASLVARRDYSPGLLLAGMALITALIIASIFGGLFPTCFVAGSGVTIFKMASEYAVSALLLVAIAMIQRQAGMDPGLRRLMVWACMLTIAAEISFSSYTTLFGLFNQLGHYLKILSFFMIYKATIQSSLTRPYDVLFRDLKHSEEALRESETMLRTIMNSSAAAVIFLDPDLRVRDFNPGAEQLLGWRRSEILGRHSLDLLVASSAREQTRHTLMQALAGADLQSIETPMLGRDGQERNIIWNAARLLDDKGHTLGVIASGVDITQRVQIAAEREKLIAELEHALAEIRALSGLLPICANCKKIRDDSGYWRQLETYLEAHSEATFSHGICPDCARLLYPELVLDAPSTKTT